MQKWALLDTETDGLYSPIHIIEVAAQRFIEKEPDGEPFRVFINHDITIPPMAKTKSKDGQRCWAEESSGRPSLENCEEPQQSSK